MSTTEDRIESLENQVRRQRRWNIALGAVVVVGGLMAATGVRSVPDVIQAKKFEVVNDEGVAVVTLASSPKSGDGIIFNHDERGFPTFLVGNQMDKDGVSHATLMTANGKGQALVELGSYSGSRGGYVETFTTNGTSTGEIP